MEQTIKIKDAQLVLGCKLNEMGGQMTIDARLLPLVCEMAPSFAVAISEQLRMAESAGVGLTPMIFDVAGNWDRPELVNVTGFVPGWLSEAVKVDQQQRDQQLESQLLARLESYVSSQVDLMGQQIGQSLEIARKETEGYSQQLVAARARLIEQIGTGSNTEFARSNEQPVKR
jgi:hypothetical protein